jgi:GDP/UDP-N,N'-diacetylbacillosamine 2-epimerase (hydrolysing)
MKKILFFTGKRGGYGALTNIINLFKKDKKFKVIIVLTDMHLKDEFGKTLKEVKKNYNGIISIDIGKQSNSNLQRTKSLSVLINKFSKVLYDTKPDIVLLLGDRGETLAATFTSIQMGVPVAHIQAGDISGGLDNIHRHAITKLSHLHFSQNENQKNRVINLGEQKKRVLNSGAPYIDNIKNSKLPKLADVVKKLKLNLNKKEYSIILHHSDTYRQSKSFDEMKVILKTINFLKIPSVIVYPCSDPGYLGIIKSIKKYGKSNNFKIFKSLEYKDYLSLLKNSLFLIGNSSSGIIEAPYFKIPFINVGMRQNNRDKCPNVIDVKANKNEIIKSIHYVINNKSFKKKLQNIKNPFGDGRSALRIYKKIKNTKLNDEFFKKEITY